MMKIDVRYAEATSTGETGCSHAQLRAVTDDGWQMIQCEICLRRWDSLTGRQRSDRQRAACTDNSPPWFTGHWRDWHRGHGCYQDDGKDRSDAAVIEIEQHRQNAATGYLTDAELSFLRARTTSGDELLVRALDELKARRVAEKERP